MGQHGGLQRDPGRVSRGKRGARKRQRTTCSKVVCCKAKCGEAVVLRRRVARRVQPHTGWASRLPPGGAFLLEAMRLGAFPQAGAHVARAGGGPLVAAQRPLAADDGGAVAGGVRRVPFATGV